MIGHKVNNYELTRLLGEGGMGAVYLAEHPLLGRKAAVKILKPEFVANQDLVQRFLNEARAANAIHHPNIIDIIDVGLLPEGVPYMMMEFLEGESLASRLQRMQRLPLGEAVKHARQTASALAAAHALGIVHRDLKPDNLFVIPDAQNPGQERIKVLDFGIAKLRPEFSPGTPKTSVGALMGTPAYMSPEQCMGKTAEIDHRSDIYALGIIFYEMLCGQPPFAGQNFGELFLQHVNGVPRPPRSLVPEIPVHIEAMILKALEKEPSDRIQTMDDFIALLAEGGGARTLVAAPPVGRTAILDDGAFPARAHAVVRSSRRPATPAPTLTTLSSTIGQMEESGDALPTVRRGRRVVLVSVGALALCALGVGVGLKYWQRPAADDRASAALPAESLQPSKATAEPLPAFVPPPAELAAPKAPEPPAAENPRKHEAATDTEGKLPIEKNLAGGERAKRHASGRSRSRGPREEQAEAPPPRALQPAAPTVAPPPQPVSPAVAPRIIKRDKF
jgi:serine/threonine-protein kinase